MYSNLYVVACKLLERDTPLKRNKRGKGTTKANRSSQHSYHIY